MSPSHTLTLPLIFVMTAILMGKVQLTVVLMCVSLVIGNIPVGYLYIYFEALCLRGAGASSGTAAGRTLGPRSG